MPGVSDFNFQSLLHSPLDFSERLLKRVQDELSDGQGQGQYDLPLPVEWELRILQGLQTTIQDGPTNWEEIPLLNSYLTSLVPTQLANNSLVRWHGMIQDTNNPELFQKLYQVSSGASETGNGTEGQSIKKDVLGLFRDSYSARPLEELVGPEGEELRNCLGERSLYYTTSIPGLNAWVDELDVENSPRIQHELTVATGKPSNPSPPAQVETNNMSLELNKQLYNFTLSSMNSDPMTKGVIVKVYDDDPNGSLYAIHGAYEFIGILCHTDPSCVSNSEHPPLPNGHPEHEPNNPPYKLIPRLHVISAQKLSKARFLSSPAPVILKALEKSRSELLGLLADTLHGDEVGAEYLLANLLSQVFSREERSLPPLGNMSLNLKTGSLGPLGTQSQLVLFLKTQVLPALLPKTLNLDLSLNNLNTETWIPRKDYNLERLCSGALQLSPGTHLFLDETQLEPGNLNSNGIENLGALKELVTQQVLRPKLEFHSTKLEMDVPSLVISEGKSLLEPVVSLDLVPFLKSEIEIEDARSRIVSVLEDPDVMSKLRGYLAHCRSLEVPGGPVAFEMEPGVQELIQTRESWLSFGSTAQGLHVGLTLARMLCYSWGTTKLSIEIWKQTMDLEKIRRERTQ